MKFNLEKIAKFKNYLAANTSSDFWIKHTKEDYLKLKNISDNKDNNEEESQDNDGEFDYFSKIFDALIEDDSQLNKLEAGDYFGTASYAMFDKISKKMTSILEQNYLPQEISVIPIMKPLEEKILLTNQALQNPNIKLIRNPFFIYYIDKNKEDILLANPVAYDKQKHILYSQNAVTSVKKLKYALKAFWESEIVKKNNLNVKEYVFLILNKEKNIKNQIEIKKENKVTYATSKVDDDTQELTFDINDLLDNGAVTIKKLRKDKILKPLSIEQFANLWTSSLINQDVETFSEYDKKSDWGKNEHENLIFVTENPQFNNINGTFLKKIKNRFFENKISEMNEIVNTHLELQNIFNKINLINKDQTSIIIKKIQESGAKVIWYDFEGFSLPFPPLDNVKPYSQIVNQVSIIKTITIKQNDSFELKIIDSESKDIIYDPQTINFHDFIDLINNVYGNEAHDAYVVFNKGYELSRMNEMKNYIEKGIKAKKIDIKEKIFIDACEKLEYIKANTVDIMLAFNKNTIFLHALKGYYSIKKVEKYITKSHMNLPHLIIPYSDLEVKNGKMAMDNAILRYTGVIGNKEWKIKAQKLKEYCHNDVLAMIMVYDFINKLIKEGVDNLNDKDIDIFH
ncbi:UU173 family protein [Mycoplasma miroungirhinis]|uniref:DUF2779 domain-containing protein n=1 Tax=Mycoplasma miroungirhinis TaxID=754516 RepID=A0A6M4JCB1_9MOLU|nr:DUF2779 domain-containing protein [Mycoplasma miroungirhinis]QJR43898.1 DUF2779 domain-containing protein [Mycoplasma miroungirhinis]